ncbi:MAG: hypothetical protein JXB17_13955 [Bacteroidales bacterium]|nr:hypothetical protein [Bacteroidales bacterium]
MNKLLITLLISFLTTTAFSQPFNRPVTLNPHSGYVAINEINSGYGLGGTNIDYSKNYVGFTTTHGYQLNIYGLNVNGSVAAGAGIGILIYNGGTLFPLYGDVRLTMNRGSVSPYFFGRGGLLISFEDFQGLTRLFANGGGGIKLRVNEQFSLNIGPGLLLQMGNNVSRDAFVNLNVGIVFKPK